MFDILDAPVECPDRKGEFPAPVKGEVVYQSVHFSYGEDRKVLEDISLVAKPGEMIALVGPTGAGKSTIVNLLPAFYELQSGSILIDGVDIRQVKLESLRNQISVVSQEPFLFNGTVLENIQYGDLDAGSEGQSGGRRQSSQLSCIHLRSSGGIRLPCRRTWGQTQCG